jgi:hypothetical protein
MEKVVAEPDPKATIPHKKKKCRFRSFGEFDTTFFNSLTALNIKIKIFTTNCGSNKGVYYAKFDCYSN